MNDEQKDFWLDLIGTLLVVGLLLAGILVVLSYFATQIL